MKNKSLTDFLLGMSEHYRIKADESRKKANFWLIMVFVSAIFCMLLTSILF